MPRDLRNEREFVFYGHQESPKPWMAPAPYRGMGFWESVVDLLCFWRR